MDLHMLSQGCARRCTGPNCVSDCFGKNQKASGTQFDPVHLLAHPKQQPAVWHQCLQYTATAQAGHRKQAVSHLHWVAVDCTCHGGLAEAALAVVQLAVAARLHLLLQAGDKGAALHILTGEGLHLIEQDLAVNHQEALHTLQLQAAKQGITNTEREREKEREREGHKQPF